MGENPPRHGEVAVAQQLTEGALGLAWRLKGQPPPPSATVPLELKQAGADSILPIDLRWGGGSRCASVG
jgi:hypothetical protein